MLFPQVSPLSPARDFEPIPRRGVNVASFVQQTAARIPDRPAVIDPGSGVSFSWAELAKRVSHTAAALTASGVRRRDTVMLLSSNHAEMVQGFWAIMHAGGVVAPPNAKLTTAEIVQLAENTQPRAVIAHVDQRDAILALQAKGFAETIFWIGEAPETPASLASHTGVLSAEPASVMLDDPSWYFFTSGSTGAPKAATFTHSHLSVVLMNHFCDLFPGEDDSGASLVVAPISHGAGIHLLAQAFTGCVSIIYNGRPFDGAQAWELIDKYGVTNAFTVPTILNNIVNAYPDDRGPNDHTLKHVVYAGAPMMAADQQRALDRLGRCLVQYFGLGEVTGAITVLRPEEHGSVPVDSAGIGTCGRARTGIELSIRNDDDSRVTLGENGEVCVAGPTICAGYLNNDAANAEAFANGWFHTGDVGYLDQRGYLFLTGRKSDMYISGGSNIYPREIEELVLTHPAVSQAAVVGVPDSQWGEVGIALVETSAPVTQEELAKYTGEHLAKYKVPKEFRVIDEMPVTAYGKIARKEIKEALEEERSSAMAGSS